MKRLALLLCLLFAHLATAAPLEWLDSFADAKVRAAAEGKLVLAIFYGSERTRNFANVREAVMDSEAFCEYARDKFVCVEKYEQKDRAKFRYAILKYRELCLEYNIRTWPTVVVATPEGVPTGGFTGVTRYEIGADRQVTRALDDEERLNIVCTALDNAIHVAEKLREAEAMPEGEDRLRALAATFYRLPENFAPRIFFAKHVADMDPENKTGLRDLYLDLREMVEWKQIGRYDDMDHATCVRRHQEMIDKARPANLLTMLDERYRYMGLHRHSPEDIAALTNAMEAYAAELEKTEPEKAADMRQRHYDFYSEDPAEGYRRLEEQRENKRQERELERQEEETERAESRKALRKMQE